MTSNNRHVDTSWIKTLQTNKYVKTWFNDLKTLIIKFRSVFSAHHDMWLTLSSATKVFALTISSVVTPNTLLGLKTPYFLNTSAVMGMVEFTWKPTHLCLTPLQRQKYSFIHTHKLNCYNCAELCCSVCGAFPHYSGKKEVWLSCMIYK